MTTTTDQRQQCHLGLLLVAPWLNRDRSSMGDRLAGKTAIVTGGARGSGAEIAKRFAAEGAAVVIADVLDEPGRATAAAIGPPARYVHCDVTSENDWAALVESIDTINVLVNNAAVLVLRNIAEHHRRRLPAHVRGERARDLPRHPRHDRADARRGRRVDREHLVDRRRVRDAGNCGLRGEQVRGARPHQDRRARARTAPYPRQRRVPRGGQHGDGRRRAAARLRFQRGDRSRRRRSRALPHRSPRPA